MSENTKKYYQEADKGRKDNKEKNKFGSEGSLLSMLLPSILGMCLCCILFLGTTWAWFTSSATTGVATIKAGSFRVESVKFGDSVLTRKDGGVYLLESDENKKLTITSTGDDLNVYYKLTFNKPETAEEKVYFTDSMKLSNGKLVYSVNIKGGKDYTLKVEPFWGGLPNTISEEQKIKDNIELSTHANQILQASNLSSATEKDTTKVEEQENSQTDETVPADPDVIQGQDNSVESGDAATSSENQAGEENSEQPPANTEKSADSKQPAEQPESVDPEETAGSEQAIDSGEATDSEQSAAPGENSGINQGGGEE